MRRPCGHAGVAEEARVWDNEDLNYRREGSGKTDPFLFCIGKHLKML